MSYTPGPLPEPRGWITDGHADGIRFRETAPAGIEELVVSSAPVYTDHQLVAHTAAEVARAVAAERERCAKLSIRIGNKKDGECPSACNGFWPDQVGFAIATAIRADPQRLQGKGE